MKIASLLLALLLQFVSLLIVTAQRSQLPVTDVYVDENGLMRRAGNGEEIYGFGINYTVPFAHAYRAAELLGVSHEQAIADDVYHFARLGFDLFRVHVWDTEISDTLGNLLENEHLRLFDYQLKLMKERGMRFVITPIAFWGNGWPEPDEPTPGFSARYGKRNSLTEEAAIRAQERYLYHFLNHVNPYTGIAYKDDPDILAFEVSNEPHHREAPEAVTRFIDRMVEAMRRTGTQKPIFYNISHSVHLAEAYFKADIQGGTFQWYPTGLGYGQELGGNYLPHVDNYHIPFNEVIKANEGARLVYEFDAADVGRSYIYPAMARSFRKAGIQIATHFSYDPTYLAYANTEYNTHYMNLAYTPRKALSLMIAGEVFHRMPLYEDYGVYPQNTSFGPFRVSYEEDLAEMVTETEFLYTNDTETRPPSASQLRRIAGYGHSPVVQYDGAGAYFLDRIEDGVWRLEVMPDAIAVRNPYGRNSLEKEVTVINWHTWPMSVGLPDLGRDFTIMAINQGNSLIARAEEHAFTVSPGTYLLTRKAVRTDWHGNSQWRNLRLGEFVAPEPTVRKTYLVHEPLTETTAGQALTITATAVAPVMPDSLVLMAYTGGWRPQLIRMDRTAAYDYSATIDGDDVRVGFLGYYILVYGGGDAMNRVSTGVMTYPAGAVRHPSDWDFYDRSTYRVRVVAPDNPVYLFDAAEDTDALARRWLPGSRVVPTEQPHEAELQVNVEELFQEDPENRRGDKHYDYSFRYFFGDKIAGRRADLSGRTALVFSGRALNDKAVKLQLALVMQDGTAYGSTIEISPEGGEYRLPLRSLAPVPLVTLPRPYPTFLPYYFEPVTPSAFRVEGAESLQFSIGPGIPETQYDEAHGVAVQRVWLE